MRVRCFQFFLSWLIFIINLNKINAQEVIEENRIVGSNITVFCNSTNENIWWTKDDKNLTKTDPRIIISNVPPNTNNQNANALDDETRADLSQKKIYHKLSISNLKINDTGNYTCMTALNTDKSSKGIVGKRIISYYIQSIITPRIIAHTRNVSVKFQAKNHHVVMYCLIEAFPVSYFKKSVSWYKEESRETDSTSSQQSEPEINSQIADSTEVKELNSTHINVTLTFNEITKRHNGTYVCRILSSKNYEDYPETVENKTTLLVLDEPTAVIDYVKGVGRQTIFMNWTINDGNDPIEELFIKFFKNGSSSSWTYYSDRVGIENLSYVLGKFEPKTAYKLRLSAKNKQGTGKIHESEWVETLAYDPNFVPEIEVKGNTHSTITIGWSPPPQELLEYVQYYELRVEHANNSSVYEEAIHQQNSRNLPYMFDNLKIATEYNFKVRACSELTKLCGNWSAVVNGTTMDYLSSEPNNIKMVCSHLNVSGRNTVSVEWETPTVPNGKIISYHIILTGIATFKTERGTLKNETYGPKTIRVDEKSHKALYDNVPSNTNYTVSVAGVTRIKKTGDQAKAICEMPTTVPENLGHWLWGKIRTETNDWVFKLFSPPISERNGPICCYRVYLVRISDKIQYNNLPLPEELDITSYHEVHAKNNTFGGAYLAEIVTSDFFSTEIFLGDGKQLKSPIQYDTGCDACMENISRINRKHSFFTSPTSIPANIAIASDTAAKLNNIDLDDDSLDDLKHAENNNKTVERRRRRRRRRRQHEENINHNDFTTNSSPQDTVGISNELTIQYFDGELDMASKYTGFVEIIVRNNNGKKDSVLSTFSDYFEEMAPGAPLQLDLEEDELSVMLKIAIMVLFGLLLFGSLLLITLCMVHRHYTRNIAQGDEIISLRDSLSRAFCHGRSSNNQHRHLITTTNLTKPPDLPPIIRFELPQAYKDRHKDSDYGFQHEFELLPDRFSDRTTKNSDSKENIYKNRYPDIKAYDQTRVKLQQINSIMGSDYINANIVIGYKERKKFICAQGPMDGTINDFWRMIWEQHLEIIVMLTNLEEYNKTKCAKYWPEKIGDSTQFGDINVYYQQEARFSDYLVRYMKITRRNHDDNEDQSRTITQYHYLVWKDFMAPEHPHGIIKFIKQINSVYSVQRGAILVHCSAGVGRTGTLVALDTLSQQLEEEGHVSIFNTVCDMRHQRNFLVQSLKQYIFLYRALTDIAQFGDTELKYKGLSGTIENLKQRANDSKEQCKLEIEFERIKSIQDDIKKTCTVGNSDDNRCKNRSELVIPFDRNRVILTPIPGRDSSTYINASFIEGYDNQESFIIAQDPMENTIPDFWRMISEHNIKTIVMLSEINNECKCPRYWADDEIQYDHILVKYIQSESCPYYTRREFTVTNCKINDLIYVTQFQYHGWPTVEGEVPEVTRGMLEIIQQSQNYHLNKKLKMDSNNDNVEYILPQNELSNSSNDISLHYNNENDDDDNIILEEDSGPIVVHCNLGTERSSIFVGMCILIQQLKLEKKIDICTMTRKLRSQRNMMIDTYAQYEFLHRAIANYADLHRLSLDSPSDC